MKWLLSTVLFCCASFPLFADAPAEEIVQGLYTGSWQDSGGSADTEVRVVAMGNGSYKLLARREIKGAVERADIDGKTTGEAIAFAGTVGENEWALTYAEGKISGTAGKDGKVAIARIVRESPALGKKAPEGAIVILDGKNFDEIETKDGSWQPVEVADDGSIQVPKGGMGSKRAFPGSFNLHIEFMNNLRATARGQGRGNSGLFLPNGKEIQVLDSFGTGTYLGGGCGGLYKFKDPDTIEPIPSMAGKEGENFNLSSLPPGQWQAYDVEFRVTDGADGKKVGHLTAYHNGKKIHDNFPLPPGTGKIKFQDHGNPVRYRNIWIQPVD